MAMEAVPHPFHGLRLILPGLFLLTMAGCSCEPAGTGPRYSTAQPGKSEREYGFAVHPLHNPTHLVLAYQPLAEYLDGRLGGIRITVEASRDYGAFEEKCRTRKPALLLPNPWQTIQAMDSGYHVIAMAGDAADFRGLLLVRKDSGLKRPADLKGKAVSYPSSTALAACIMPQYLLHRSGLDMSRDVEHHYVGSQESSIRNAYLGKTAAGATWPQPWRAFVREHPDEAAELTVLCETEPLVNNSVMARDDVPPEVQGRIRELLVALHQTEEGRVILAGMETTRFFRASDRDYDVVRTYVRRFEAEVRAVGK